MAAQQTNSNGPPQIFPPTPAAPAAATPNAVNRDDELSERASQFQKPASQFHKPLQETLPRKQRLQQSRVLLCAPCPCSSLGMQTQGKERKAIFLTVGVVVGVEVFLGVACGIVKLAFGIVKLVHLVHHHG